MTTEPVTDWRQAAEAALTEIMFDPDLTGMDALVGVLATSMGGGSADPRGQFLAIGQLASGSLYVGLTETLELLCRKQHDYGHGNILRFGHQGLVVRLSDKIERLKNLGTTDPSNESVQDSYMDIVGYCAIGLMLCDGTFELELA